MDVRSGLVGGGGGDVGRFESALGEGGGPAASVRSVASASCLSKSRGETSASARLGSSEIWLSRSSSSSLGC